MEKYTYDPKGEMGSILKHIGTIIRQHRIKNNLSLEELGLKCRMDHQLLEKMEMGGVDFSLLDIYAVAHAFKIDVKELLP